MMITGSSSRVFCPICMDHKPAGQMFRGSNCTHSFCNECMGTYISTRIRDNISGLHCPDPNCRVNLDPSNCRGVVPKEVLERWENALREARILASEKLKSGESYSKKLDEMAMELAWRMKWQRCPNCNFYVEKNQGCNHITCRCYFQFCYECGDKWTGNDHICAR